MSIKLGFQFDICIKELVGFLFLVDLEYVELILLFDFVILKGFFVIEVNCEIIILLDNNLLFFVGLEFMGKCVFGEDVVN